MKENPYRQDREEMMELLRQYKNFKEGKKFDFIEEESFERIIEYFDENENLLFALEAANFAIEQFPYSGSLLIKKADILIASRQFIEALQLLERAETLQGADMRLYILKTDVYLALNNPEKAAAILEEAIFTFEGSEKTELLFELADVYDDYEEFDKVFECLRMILHDDPENEEALYKICFWTDYTGRNEESIQLHQQIIEQYPYCQLAWFNLGTAYQGLKLYEKSIDAYLFAIAIDEKFDYAYRNLGDAYLRIRNYKEAIEALQKVLELTLPETVIYEAIGHCYEKLKNPAQARYNYRKAVHLNSVDSHLYHKIALTYMQEGYWESAIKNLNTALNINKLQADFHLSLAECYIQLERTKDAVMHLGQFIKMRPRNEKGWKNLIKCLYDGGYYEEAYEQVLAAQENTNHKPLFIYYKSAILFELGKSKEALLQLQNAINIAPAMVKLFIEINPSILQNPTVAALIASCKPKKKSK